MILLLLLVCIQLFTPIALFWFVNKVWASTQRNINYSVLWHILVITEDKYFDSAINLTSTKWPMTLSCQPQMLYSICQVYLLIEKLLASAVALPPASCYSSSSKDASRFSRLQPWGKAWASSTTSDSSNNLLNKGGVHAELANSVTLS